MKIETRKYTRPWKRGLKAAFYKYMLRKEILFADEAFFGNGNMISGTVSIYGVGDEVDGVYVDGVKQ